MWSRFVNLEVLLLFRLGPKLNTKIGLHTTTHHKELLDQKYLSCDCPFFDETLKLGPWEHLEQIQTAKETFIKLTFVLATFIHIRNQLLLSQFWPN